MLCILVFLPPLLHPLNLRILLLNSQSCVPQRILEWLEGSEEVKQHCYNHLMHLPASLALTASLLCGDWVKQHHIRHIYANKQMKRKFLQRSTQTNCKLTESKSVREHITYNSRLEEPPMCICTIQGTQTYYFLSTDAYPLTLWGAVWSSSTQRYQV